MFLVQIKRKSIFEVYKNVLILQFLLSTVFSSKLQTQSKLRQSDLTKEFVEVIKLILKKNVYFKVQEFKSVTYFHCLDTIFILIHLLLQYINPQR